ncbi:hypothetical protein BDQ17DRAFT_1389780 [Cyathus striatus]|nr:hypothetical protein BDQ17DRAFT_1389780 [Cyathus striatus]
MKKRLGCLEAPNVAHCSEMMTSYKATFQCVAADERQRATYGQALPDQVDRIAALFDAHSKSLHHHIFQVREIYRERAALEREYAGKLQLLTKKAAEKKAKMEVSYVVGDDPTKSWDTNTLKQNSLNTAYDEIIASMNNTTQDHFNIADALNAEVVVVLAGIERRNEEAKKKEMQFFQKLLSDRDKYYANRLKYDDECAEVESFRQKQGRAQDDRHAERAVKQAEQQRNDMLNSKNTYIISTAIANSAKAKFYNEDLPAFENLLSESLQARLVDRFVKILIHSQNLSLTHLDKLKTRITGVDSKLKQVNSRKDQEQFIEYNIRHFIAPDDWKFEPSSVHYDTDSMNTEPSPKVFLQNKLSKCSLQLQELQSILNTKRRELDQLSQRVSQYKPDHLLGEVDKLTDNHLEAQHQLMSYTTSELVLNTEVDTIVKSIGNDVGAGKLHAFKSSSFSIPTSCAYCKSSIWGLSKQGKTCKLCGISVHNKCELKVPADCQNSTETSSVTMTRTNTISSRNSIRGRPIERIHINYPSSITDSISTSTSSASSFSKEEDYPSALVLFDFAATSEFELNAAEGTTVHIIEHDDGSGWVKVADKTGSRGLVPATYLEIGSSANTSRKTSSTFVKQRVRALYNYEAGGNDEISLKEGDILELSSGPSGGTNFGDGWWEGFDAHGRKGIFPSNYVKLI